MNRSARELVFFNLSIVLQRVLLKFYVMMTTLNFRNTCSRRMNNLKTNSPWTYSF